MKLLFLSQGRTINDHPGWNDALEKLKQEHEVDDFINIPYLGYAEKYGWDAFYSYVVQICKSEDVHVVYFHYFHSNEIPSPRKCIEELVALPNRPIVITSSGDPFSDNSMMPDYPTSFKEASRLADITFSTQMGKAADKMIQWGTKNVVYTPNSMCQIRFQAHKIEPETHNFDFDVVFVGNNNNLRYPNLINKHWWGAKHRNDLVKALDRHYGKQFGLFGKGWNYGSSQGPTPFSEQQKTFQRGRILVGGNPYSYSDYYSSNRVFFEVASGIPTVELITPRFDHVLRNNEHVYFVSDIQQLLKKVDFLLESDPITLYSKAAEAAKYIEQNHTQYHRMKFKIDTVKRYIANNNQLDVHFPFFLPEINVNEEMQYAIRTSSSK